MDKNGDIDIAKEVNVKNKYIRKTIIKDAKDYCATGWDNNGKQG